MSDKTSILADLPNVDLVLQSELSTLFESSLTTNGYQKLPGGLIIQWGVSNNATVNPNTVTLPIPFPNQGLVVIAADWSASYSPNVAVNTASARFLSNSQIQTASTSGTALIADSLQWIAIGY